MSRRIFLTGASGFVGSKLLRALQSRSDRIVALDRSGSLRRLVSESPRLQIVAGDLLEPDSYRSALAGTDVVLHLAAATGRATASDHLRTNVEGTATLLDACEKAGIARVLFVSSIAVKFPDKSRYDYARAKTRAEEIVRQSRMRHTIVRPTIILGPGSSALSALERLAVMPLVPVFGDGQTLVQPVHVDDVVAALLRVLDADRFSNETFEVGGPEALSIENLLRTIRKAARPDEGRFVHVPFGLAVAPLRIARALGLARLMPIAEGQLSSFRYDGRAEKNDLDTALDQTRRGVQQMIARAPDAGRTGSRDLDHECRTFTRLLLGMEANDYVIQKYAEAHGPSRALSGRTPSFDRFLVAFAGTHRIAAKAADAYARVFLPESLLRRKLTLLFAILETCPPFSRVVDGTAGRGRSRALGMLAAAVSGGLVSLIIGTIVLGPARLAFALAGRTR